MDTCAPISSHMDVWAQVSSQPMYGIICTWVLITVTVTAVTMIQICICSRLSKHAGALSTHGSVTHRGTGLELLLIWQELNG